MNRTDTRKGLGTLATATAAGLFGIGLGFFGAVAPANALLIDDFNLPNPTTVPDASTCPAPSAGHPQGTSTSEQCTFVTAPSVTQSTSFTAPAGHVIGNVRDMSTTSLANGLTRVDGNTYSAPSPASLFAQVSQSQSGAGVFTHNQPSGLAGFSFLHWATGGVDLTAGGKTAFQLGLIFADHEVGWGLGLKDNLGHVATFYFLNPSDVSAPPEAFLNVQFSSFSGVDLTNITDISFVANYAEIGSAACNSATHPSSVVVTGDQAANVLGGTVGTNHYCVATAFDTQVDYIDTVPEPATLAILGSALLGFGVVRRRRRS